LIDEAKNRGIEMLVIYRRPHNLIDALTMSTSKLYNTYKANQIPTAAELMLYTSRGCYTEIQQLFQAAYEEEPARVRHADQEKRRAEQEDVKSRVRNRFPPSIQGAKRNAMMASSWRRRE
jgi:hypothetical protein